jgi:hypothetical protein
MIQRIVNHLNFTPALGEDLGITSPVVAFSKASGKPTFSAQLTSGGYPLLVWLRGKFEGVEIWKDSGSGFVKLDRDMRPDYIDKSTLPAAGASAAWRYKMIYLINDEHVGVWSDVVTVTVYGEV